MTKKPFDKTRWRAFFVDEMNFFAKINVEITFWT